MSKKKEEPIFDSYNKMLEWATWTIISRLIKGDLEGGVNTVVQTVRHKNALGTK